MPLLKDLRCSIELDRISQKLQEYGTAYSDGLVETFIAIPTEPKKFTVRLTSSAYIAEGLAVYVFINGQYQCNRNRRGLVKNHSFGKPLDRRTLVDFRLRQKEERQQNGDLIASDWIFERSNLEFADKSPKNRSHKVGDNLDCIEVVVLRCKGDRLHRAPKVDGKNVTSGRTGFDGAHDLQNNHFGHDGSLDDWDYDDHRKSTPKGISDPFGDERPPPPLGDTPPFELPQHSSHPSNSRSRQRLSGTISPGLLRANRVVPPGYTYGFGPVPREGTFESDAELFSNRTPHTMSGANIVDPTWLRHITESAYKRGLENHKQKQETEKMSQHLSGNLQPPQFWPPPTFQAAVPDQRTSPQAQSLQNQWNAANINIDTNPKTQENLSDRDSINDNELARSWSTSSWGTNRSNADAFKPKEPVMDKKAQSSAKQRRRKLNITDNWGLETDIDLSDPLQNLKERASASSNGLMKNSPQEKVSPYVRSEKKPLSTGNWHGWDTEALQIDSSSSSSGSSFVSPRDHLAISQSKRSGKQRIDQRNLPGSDGRRHNERTTQGSQIGNRSTRLNETWNQTRKTGKKSSGTIAWSSSASSDEPQGLVSKHDLEKPRKRVHTTTVPNPFQTSGPSAFSPPPYSGDLKQRLAGFPQDHMSIAANTASGVQWRSTDPRSARDVQSHDWSDDKGLRAMPGSWEDNDSWGNEGDNPPDIAVGTFSDWGTEDGKAGGSGGQEFGRRQDWFDLNEPADVRDTVFWTNPFKLNWEVGHHKINEGLKENKKPTRVPEGERGHTSHWLNESWDIEQKHNDAGEETSKVQDKVVKEKSNRKGRHSTRRLSDSWSRKGSSEQPQVSKTTDMMPNMPFNVRSDTGFPLLNNTENDNRWQDISWSAAVPEVDKDKKSHATESQSRLHSYRRHREPVNDNPQDYWSFPPPLPSPISQKKTYPIPKEYSKKGRQDEHANVGMLYTHAVGRPEYLDSFKKPYAVFRFKYRTREHLKKMLGDSVPDEEPIASVKVGEPPTVVKEKLKAMDEERKDEEIIWLMKKLEHEEKRRKKAHEHHKEKGTRKEGKVPPHVVSWVGDQRERSRQSSLQNVVDDRVDKHDGKKKKRAVRRASFADDKDASRSVTVSWAGSAKGSVV